MNKELLQLLDSINETKVTIRNLVTDGKIDEARAEKAKLQEMQDKFDLLKDIEDTTEPKKPEKVKSPVDSIKSFADAARHGFENVMKAGSLADGGYTVPSDIQTKVNKYREVQFSLQDLVTVENVTKSSGSKVFMKKKAKKGFTKTGEGESHPEGEAPEFEKKDYNVSKYSGYLPATEELFEDSDENITNIIVEWLGDESRVTRNKLIINAINTEKADSIKVIKTIDDITKILNIELGAAYKPTSAIITNEFGIQVLQELKDANGRPILNPNPSDPMKMQITAGANIIPIKEVPVADLPNTKVSEVEYPTFIIGDLKEGIVLFDRNKITIKHTDQASVGTYKAFEHDLIIFKGTEREDVQVKDADAFVLARFNTKAA